MDSFVAVSSTALKQWIVQWEQWLDLWMECGAVSLGPMAVSALNHWLNTCPSTGWNEVHVAASRLQSSSTTDKEKADSLLDLITWQRTSQRIIDVHNINS